MLDEFTMPPLRRQLLELLLSVLLVLARRVEVGVYEKVDAKLKLSTVVIVVAIAAEDCDGDDGITAAMTSSLECDVNLMVTAFGFVLIILLSPIPTSAGTTTAAGAIIDAISDQWQSEPMQLVSNLDLLLAARASPKSSHPSLSRCFNLPSCNIVLLFLSNLSSLNLIPDLDASSIHNGAYGNGE